MTLAEVVKLVDAHGSGPCELALMWVRVPPSAHKTNLSGL